MIKYVITGAAAVSILGLAACSGGVRKPANLVAQCQAEVAPPGTYQYEEGHAVPVMTPVNDGSQAGADAFNACIRHKAVLAGLLSDPATARGGFCPDGAPPIYGGATYCIGTN